LRENRTIVIGGRTMVKARRSPVMSEMRARTLCDLVRTAVPFRISGETVQVSQAKV
jgi:hypothetical protein